MTKIAKKNAGSTKGAAKKGAAKQPKAAATKPAATTAIDACPQGDAHDWMEENGDRFCAKCKAPAPQTQVAAPAVKKPRAKASPAPVDPKPSKPKKLTAIDAAAQVLRDAKAPMSSKELIAAMAEKQLWSSPAGQTPHATLYSAILREISGKGADARFIKCEERGKFAIKA